MNIRKSALLASCVAGAAFSAPVHAAGTQAGSTIENNFSVQYTVGSTTTTEQTSAADGNSAAFVVDRKVDLTVTREDTQNKTFGPGDTKIVTTFRVTNTSNEVMDFSLAAANVTGDAGDMQNFKVYVESAATPDGYTDGVDTATFVDELAADTSVVVYVLADDKGELTDQEVADITLLATARQTLAADGKRVATSGALGDVLTATPGGTANGLSTVETVFADAVNSSQGDTTAANSGSASAVNSYELSTATLALSKLQTLISDPTGSSVPKSVPGAVVEYCLQVTNSGSDAASAVSFTDTLPAGLTPDTASNFRVGDSSCTGTDGASEDASAGGNGSILQDGGGVWTVSASLASIPAPVSPATSVVRTVRFQATID